MRVRAAVLPLLLLVTACGGAEQAAAPVPEPVSAEVTSALESGVSSYRAYVLEQAAATRTATRAFTDAVRAGDVAAAREAYAPSRVGWERIEPIAGLVEELDGRLDARVDDFAGVEDPEFTGWHRLEHLVFERGTAEGGAPFADQLDADLVTLEQELAEVEITALDLARGAGELVEEVTRGKITGEEDRYSHTDLWDVDANIDGSASAVERLRPALSAQDPALLAEVEQGLDAVVQGLAPYELPGGGFRSYEELSEQDRTRLGAELASLSESMSQVPGTLGLE